VLKVASDIILQLRLFKYQKGNTPDGGHNEDKEMHVALLFVIHTVDQYSYMIVCGGREKYLATKAFPGMPFSAASPQLKDPSEFVKADETLVGPLEGVVSRKLQFLPMVTKVIVEEGVPDFFHKTGIVEQEPVKRALSDAQEDVVSDSVRMRWGNLRVAMNKEIFGKATPAPLGEDMAAEEAKVRESFRNWDTDQNGFITQEELVTAMMLLHPDMTPDVIKEMTDAADVDQDGYVSYEEFLGWLFQKGS